MAMRSHKNDLAKGRVNIGLGMGMDEGRKINRNVPCYKCGTQVNFKLILHADRKVRGNGKEKNIQERNYQHC